MSKANRFVATIAGAVFCAALISAHTAGPDLRHTGAPGDDPLACSDVG